jgi:hypothetical protein
MLHPSFQERRTLLTPRRIQTMVHHHLKGSPWQHPLEDGVGEGVGNITYSWGKATLLYNQAASPHHPMPWIPWIPCSRPVHDHSRCAMGAWVRESRILLHVGHQMANNCRMDRSVLRWLQGKLDGTSTYHAHVDQRFPYDTLHVRDASMTSMVVYV